MFIPNLSNLEEPLQPHEILAKTELGFFLYVDNRDSYVGKYIYNQGIFKPEIAETLQKLVCRGDNIIELGTHYGYHTLFLSKKVGPKGKVIAFEPNPSVFSILEKNISLYNISLCNENIAIYPLALTDKVGTAQFFGGFPNVNDGFILGPYSTMETLERIEYYQDWNVNMINATTLDALGDHKNIDFIIMNAKGAEMLCVYGAKQLLDYARNIKLIISWDRMLLARYGNCLDFIHFLQKMGFSFYKIHRHGQLIYQNQESLLKLGKCDVLITRWYL